MIYGLIPIGGSGKRLSLPFSKEMLPLKGYDQYFPVVSHIVNKMLAAGATQIVFIHGNDLKQDVVKYFSSIEYKHITQETSGFANVLKDFYTQINPQDNDKILFGLPDSVFENCLFKKMLEQDGIACGLFVTSDISKVDRLNSQNIFDVKNWKTSYNSKWFWGVIKFDGADLKKFISDKIFDTYSEIGHILNKYKLSFVYGENYIDLGTWESLNSYWSNKYYKTSSLCQITKDWAAAFDELTILLVKDARLGNQQNKINLLRQEISSQLDCVKFFDVLYSKEYRQLLDANLALFDGVEKVRHGDGLDAKIFDDLNQNRHKAKKELQIKFWDNELTEIKT